MWAVNKVLRPTSLDRHSSVAKQHNVYNCTALKLTYLTATFIQNFCFSYHL